MGAGENTHHRNDDDTNQRVFDINTGAWILQFVKIINNILNAGALTLNNCTITDSSSSAMAQLLDPAK